MSEKRVMLDDVSMTPFLVKVTLFSSGGPFLEGYVLGINNRCRFDADGP